LFVGSHAALSLDRPWLYLSVLIGALVYLRRRRPRWALVVASMGAAVALNQLIFFFVGMSAAFRYEYLAVPVALLCAVYAGAELVAARRPTC
jgi:hypothetical protein